MKYLGSISDANDLVTKAYVDNKAAPYGVCSTAAATAAKTVTVDAEGFMLETGICVRVKFSSSNTASSPTLNVNGTGAKAIKRYGTTAVSTSVAASWNAGSVLELTYDGTNWIINNFLNTTYSSMSVSEYEAGTGTSARLITPARLKAAILTWAAEKDHTHDYSDTYAPLSHSHDEYALTNHTHSGYAASSHTHDYLPLAGGALTGQLLFSTGTTQSATKGIKWSAINSKNPYIGYALNQTDGTFLIGSLLGTNYQDGLAIGGGSGNLLWKGVRVVDASSSMALTNKTYNGYTLAEACAKDVDIEVKSGSANLVTSGAVYSAIAAAQVSGGGEGIAASARGSASSLSCTAGTITKITLDTWISRTDETFTFSSDGGITCPYDGVLMISGSAYVAVTDGAQGGCYVKKGAAFSSSTEITSQLALGTKGGVSAGTVILPVTAGEIIYLCGRRSTAGTVLPANTATHLDVAYIR